MSAPEMAAAHRNIRRLDRIGLALTLATVLGAILWAFPLYWAVITTLKPEAEVVQAGVVLWPRHFTLDNYFHVLFDTKIGL